MGLFTGKKGMVLGVANDYSIAWAISRYMLDEGAEIGFTHLPGDKMEAGCGNWPNRRARNW